MQQILSVSSCSQRNGRRVTQHVLPNLLEITMRRIYAASSWRNKYHREVVSSLRQWGHLVYDFKSPAQAKGFAWSDIDPDWERWSRVKYRSLLWGHPRAAQGFMSDYRAMQWADTCVLILPAGRSAHIEAGYFNGANKNLIIYMPEDQEPDLMYLMAQEICFDWDELKRSLA